MAQKAELYCPTCHGRMAHSSGLQERICPFCGTKMLTNGNDIVKVYEKTLEIQPKRPEKRPNALFWAGAVIAVGVLAALAFLLLR